MDKVKTGCFILIYFILALIVYFTGFDLMEVFAVELWGYQYPINYSDIRYKNGINGSENNLSNGVSSSTPFAVGVTDKISYTPYWSLFTTGFVNGHAYELRFPVCTMDTGNPYQITHFDINGSTSNRTLNHYSIVGQDSSPYIATSGPVTALVGCGTVTVNFDYTGSNSSANSTNYINVNTTATNNSAKRWVVWGFYLEDLGTSATLMRSQADRIINALSNSAVLDDIDSNINDINSNLGYDGSQSDISNPNDSTLQDYLSNQNNLLNDSNISDFDFSDNSLTNTDSYNAIEYLMSILGFLLMGLPWIASLVGVALTLSIVALLLNRK